MISSPLAASAFSVCLLLITTMTPVLAHSPNLALGRSYEMDPMPRYPIGVEDPDDAVQLTDGRYSDDPQHLFWRNPLTVGWMLAAPPIVVVDLEASQAITGASYSTAAEHGGVTWPRQILLFSSEDKESWTLLGDLVELTGNPASSDRQSNAATLRRYTTRELNAKGRYIAFAIQPEPGKENYVFCDEIEVYGGTPTATGSTLAIEGKGLEAIRKTLLKRHILVNIRERLRRDADGVTQRLKTISDLPAAQVEKIKKRLQAVREEIATLPLPDPEHFRAQFPINALHAEILSLYGELLAQAKLPAIAITHQPRYQLPTLFPTPDQLASAGPVRLALKMMQQEYRAETLLLTNTTGRPLQAHLQWRNADGTPMTFDKEKPWLKVHPIPWTDTLQLQPVASALPEHAPEAPFTLLPGMTTKLWLAIDSRHLPPGVKEYQIAVIEGESEQVIPMRLEVSPVRLQRPRLALGAWEYTNPKPGLALTPENLKAARELMRSHYVNMTWATRTILPWPEGSAFNAQHELMEPLDFTLLEQWKKDWEGARHFCVFIHAQPEFAGVAMETPAFQTRVAAWAKALGEKAAALKLPLVIQIVDEPHNEKQDAIVIAWAKAIRAGAPHLQLVENPTWLRPDQTRQQQAITLPHILMPYIIRYQEGGEPVSIFFEARRRAGQTLWFYQCSGPIRLLDPTRYYRSFPWWAFQRHGEAITVWAFADTGVGGAGHSPLTGNSWNEYAGNNFNYSPVFLTPESVTDSLHWQAMREGVQDHEYLAMLADLVQENPDAPWSGRALSLLENGPAAVIEAGPLDALWHSTTIPADLPDQWRLKALELLEEASRR